VQVVEGIEGLYGSRFDDVLIGDGGANRLFGSDGDDVLVGKGGIDVISGGLGTDACDLGLPGTGETIDTCEE
jgi:Ca2+-binding RTX toxin-like protein